jgi:hypothetical protein
VQRVTLAERRDRSFATGLRLPVTVLDVTSDPYARLGVNSDGLLPFAGQTHTWRVEEHPDGTSTLTITLYPLEYNPLTTNVSYWPTFRFDVAYADSPAAITALRTDAVAYRLGALVSVEAEIEQRGEARDLVVSAMVRRSSTGEVVDGLLLRTLAQLSGAASFSPSWESEGFEAGDYEIEVALTDHAGTVLDRRTLSFTLGVTAGEIDTFTVGPTRFDVGEPIEIDVGFRNTGDVPATGRTVVRVHDGQGRLVEELSHGFADVPPGGQTAFADTWHTAGMAEGTYTIVAQAVFNGTSTDPVLLLVDSLEWCYLPLVHRQQ